jgi:hypothetical protein
MRRKPSTLPLLTPRQVSVILDANVVVQVKLPSGGQADMRVKMYKRSYGKDRWGLEPVAGSGLGYYQTASLLMPDGWKDCSSLLLGMAYVKARPADTKKKQTWANLVARIKRQGVNLG